MTLLRQHEHVETLSCADKCLSYTHRIARMDIVVDVSMYKEKVALEILRNLRICSDLVYECRVTLL